MNVVAVSTPHHPDWRWRIVDYDGAMVEESYAGFATIAAAVADGNERLRRHAEREVPVFSRRAR